MYVVKAGALANDQRKKSRSREPQNVQNSVENVRKATGTRGIKVVEAV